MFGPFSVWGMKVHICLACPQIAAQKLEALPFTLRFKDMDLLTNIGRFNSLHPHSRFRLVH